MQMTDKQQIAVDNYCLKGIANRDIGYSWSQAMREAGYKEGYIDSDSYALKQRPEVKKAIEEAKTKFRERITLEAEDVINELTILGFSNIEDYLQVDEEGEVHLRGFKGINRIKLAAIESIKVNTTTNKDDSRTYTTTQFKLHSKLTALEALCKHLGLFQADNEQNIERQQLDARQLIEARRIAVVLLTMAPEAIQVDSKVIEGDKNE